MISYVVTRDYFNTVIEYFGTYGKMFGVPPRLVFYDQLQQARHVPGGTYIFSDVERLAPGAAERAARVWHDLHAAGKEVRLLNHPTRSMRRYELLRTLYEDGINAFNVYRLTEQRMPQRFPVFIRSDDHSDDVSPLLHTPEALTAAIDDLWCQGQSRDDKLIVEFCDTADAGGTYRKYGAFIVGACVVPAHLFFSRHWLTKQMSADDHDATMLQEEREYMDHNPHAEVISAIARRACIDYGRIDYSMHNGSIQVWEINTNPQLPVPLRHFAVVPEQVPQLHASMHKFTAALAAVEHHARSRSRIAISPPKNRGVLWAKRGIRVLPRRYQPAVERTLRQLHHVGAALRGNLGCR